MINLAISQLEQTDINSPLCPKKMQINLTGFLEDKAAIFMKELWNLLLVSQRTEGGIAPDFIQAKKAELLRRKEEIEKKKAMMLKLKQVIKQGKPEETKELSRGKSAAAGDLNVNENRTDKEKYKKEYNERVDKAKDGDQSKSSRHHHHHHHHKPRHSAKHRKDSSSSEESSDRSEGRKNRSKSRSRSNRSRSKSAERWSHLKLSSSNSRQSNNYKMSNMIMNIVDYYVDDYCYIFCISNKDS